MSFFKHVHVNKDKIKASFDINVKNITHLSSYNGKPVNLSWKRGKRPTNAGTLRDVVVENGDATWNDKFTVQVTLFKDTGVDKFDEKTLLLQLQQGHKLIGKLKIDMGEIAKHDGTTPIEIPFDKKNAQSPRINILVHAKWLKLNDRLLVRLEDGPGAEVGNGSKSIDIDGHGYNLKTDDAMTESVDTTSGSWEEEDESREHYGHGEHDPFANASVFEAETRKYQDELDTVRKQLRLVEGQSSERAKTIELQEKEILSLRNKMAESEEMVQKATSVEGFMDQQMALLRQEHDEGMRQLKEQHQKVLDEEMERHREELETALTRAQLCLLSPSLPHNGTAEAEAFKKERDELLQQRDNLQQKVQLVTKELEESAKALVTFDERLSKKDEKILRLKDEVKSLYLSLNNVTESNQALKEKKKSMKRMNLESSSEAVSGSDRPIVPRPVKPLFANPLVDKYCGLLFLAAFLLVLVSGRLLTSV